jgi:hypothetical protein
MIYFSHFKLFVKLKKNNMNFLYNFCKIRARLLPLEHGGVGIQTKVVAAALHLASFRHRIAV